MSRRALHYRCIAVVVLLVVLFPFAPGHSDPCIDVRLTTSGLSVPRGAEVAVELETTDDLTGREVVGFVAEINYDPELLDYVQDGTCSGVAYSGGWLVASSNSAPGVVSIAGVGPRPLSGLGCLRRLTFVARSDAPLGRCSVLGIRSFEFNAGAPCTGTMTPSQVCVSGVPISGSVRYYAGPGFPLLCDNGDGVPLVRALLTDVTGQQIYDVAITGDNGRYRVFALPGSSAAVQFMRRNEPDDYTVGSDVAAALTSNDVGTFLQLITGSDLNGCPISVITDPENCPLDMLEGLPQKEAADVDGDGRLTALDGSLIAQVVANKAAGTPQDIPQLEGLWQWRFFCETKSFNSVNTSKTYDTIALLPGDVTGNYVNGGGYGKPSGAAVVGVGEVQAVGRDVLVPIAVRGSPVGALGVEVRLEYDPEILQFESASDGPSTRGWLVLAKCTAGKVGLVVAGTQSLQEGSIALLQFTRLTPDGMPATSRLDLPYAMVGDVVARTESGYFFAVPTAVRLRSWGDVKRLYKD